MRVVPIEKEGKLWLPPPEFGAYCFYEGHWWVVPPEPLERAILDAEGMRLNVGPQWGSIEEHEVTEHEDGAITVNPSIAYEGIYKYDGWLRRGEWDAT